MTPTRSLLVLAFAAGGCLGIWTWAGRPTLFPTTGAAAPQAQARSGGPGPATAVITAAVQEMDFPILRRTIGNIEAMATVVVRSRVDSQLLEQHVQDGQFVRKGDLLFTLDDKELRAAVARDEANLARDEAALARAQADLQRKKELLSSGSGAQQQVDQAIADAKAAEAAVAADQATLDTDRLRLSYTRITAPIDGRLGTVQVTPGNIVRAADAVGSGGGGGGLVTITQVKPIRVSFTLPERELAGLRKAANAPTPPSVRVYASGSKTPLATGPLTFIDSAVDVASGTITARATFANDDLALWPGQYVDVEVDLGSRPDTVVLPTVAVQQGQAGPYVFVAKPGGTVELRNVAIIATEGDRSAVEGGLSAGERVVVDGQLRLANGARVRDATPASTADDGKVGPAAAATPARS